MTSERCTGQCWWPWRKKSLKTEWLRHRLWIVQFSHHWKLLRLPSFLLLLHLSRTSMEVRLWRRRPSPSRRTSIGENVKSMMQGEMDKAPSIPLRYIMQHIWNANFIFHENNPLSWQEQEKKKEVEIVRGRYFRSVTYRIHLIVTHIPERGRWNVFTIVEIPISSWVYAEKLMTIRL